MSAWSEYENRMNVLGVEERDMWLNRSKSTLYSKLQNSLSFHTVKMNGLECNLSITHRQNTSEKRVCSMPGEKLAHGGIVDFNSSKWLITEVDGDTEVYQRGLMRRCNHVLRWIGHDGNIKEKWCIVEDGTKYLIGEFSERIMSIGDARIAVTIGKDDDTIELSRGMRFIIDDSDVDNPLVYRITKPNRLFNIYDNEGVFKFILNEVVLEDGDNVKLQIANYKDWKPQQHLDGDHVDCDSSIAEIVDHANAEASKPKDDNKEGWL